MASEKPSAWAKQEANRLFGWRGPLTHDEMVRLATALDAAKAEGVEECHANRDHADRDARALAADRVGLAWAGGNLPPMWDDILDAAREQGRNEREAEIVAWAEKQAAIIRADGTTIVDAAWLAAYQQIGEDIKRGAGRKEDK